jgi:DNA polymerase-3 subunit epsilon
MFKKDLLVLDIESTGLDFRKHEIIQIAAVQLDRKTLKEKKRFESYIKPRRWSKRDPEAMAVNNITWDSLKEAPGMKTVLKKFQKTFGANITIAPYGTILDTLMLRVAYQECKMRYPFDYHVFDIWPLVYTYLAKKNLLKNKRRFAGFSLDDAARHFKITIPADRHTALTDVLVEAEVLRQIIKRLKV